MNTKRIASVHPFPARMAPSIILETLAPSGDEGSVVFDPMTGSGTTIVSARQRGYTAVGVDSDPLAVLIANVWSQNLDSIGICKRAELVLKAATLIAKDLRSRDSYPENADEETNKFVNFWFDLRSRKQLRALQVAINTVVSAQEKNVLLCALSRLIITKSQGVSRAMDVSHSRPHRVYAIAPVAPFDRFLHSISHIVKNAPFSKGSNAPQASVNQGDARKLERASKSVDIVITSPPYLHAIDYMRGHKLSLVWMGHSVASLRNIRSTNVGAHSMSQIKDLEDMASVMSAVCAEEQLSKQHSGMVYRYVEDLEKVIGEIYRILKVGGSATFVVADSLVKGTVVSNSLAVHLLAERSGLALKDIRKREISANHRYLPAPKHESSGRQMQSRMRDEWIMTFRKSKQLAS